MKNESKPKYSLLQNLRYHLKNLLAWNKDLAVYSLIKIFPTLLIPLVGVYLPKIILSEISEKVSPEHFLVNTGGIILILIFLNVIDGYIETILEDAPLLYRTNYLFSAFTKTIDADYDCIDDPSTQTLWQKTIDSTFNSNAGTEKIIPVSIRFISNLLGIILYGAVIISLNPYILLLLILTSLINYKLLNWSRKHEQLLRDKIAPIDNKLWYLTSKASEFSSGKDIRIYDMSIWFIELFKKLIKQKKKYHQETNSRYFVSNIADGFLILIRDGIVYAYLIYMIVSKQMSVADFILYFGMVTGFSIWLSGIINDLHEFNRISYDFSVVREYLDMPDKWNSSKGIPLPSGSELPCSIELKNVWFTYPGTDNPTISNLNLKINAGEKLAIVGINGTGKTTLVKLICGLYHPTSGEIFVNGKNIELFNRDKYYSLISAVFQDVQLLPTSLEKNIAMCPASKIDKEKLLRCINLAGLDDKINTLPKGLETNLLRTIHEDAVEFSGGETQKLLLARALYKDTPIIILDEPTSALDPIAENNIYLKYTELVANKTSIFISHRLSSTRFCDRIIFLENGRVIEEGTHDTLMKIHGKYAEMFEVQRHYYKEQIKEETLDEEFI